MTVPIPPPITRRPPPDPRASSTFSLSLLPCQSIYLVSLHAIHLRLPSSGIVMRRQTAAAGFLTSHIRHLTSDIRHSRFPREAVAYRNHPGGSGRFSPRARRAFLSREADYRLDLQKTRRLLRCDDGFA